MMAITIIGFFWIAMAITAKIYDADAALWASIIIANIWFSKQW